MSVVDTPAHAPRRARGPKPRYTHAEIVQVAVTILSQEGIGGFNLRALSRRLGLTPMAIYGYFEDKDDLIDAVIASRLAPLVPDIQRDVPWDEELTLTIREMYFVLCETPAIAELAATRKPGPRLDPFRQRLLSITARGGLARRDSDHALRALTSYVFGAALVAPVRGHRTTASRQAFEFGLGALVDAARRASPSDG